MGSESSWKYVFTAILRVGREGLRNMCCCEPFAPKLSPERNLFCCSNVAARAAEQSALEADDDYEADGPEGLDFYTNDGEED